jgi:hypothetical protein
LRYYQLRLQANTNLRLHLGTHPQVPDTGTVGAWAVLQACINPVVSCFPIVPLIATGMDREDSSPREREQKGASLSDVPMPMLCPSLRYGAGDIIQVNFYRENGLYGVYRSVAEFGG